MNILYNAIIGDYNSAKTIGVKQKIISQARALNDLGCNCHLKLITTSEIKGGIVFEGNFKFEIQPLKVKNVLLRRKEIFNIFYKNTVSGKFDIVYIRYPLADQYFIKYLQDVYQKSKIVLEHQAIERRELLTKANLKRILKYILEVKYHKKSKRYISAIVSVTKEIEKYQKQIVGEEISSIVIGNGVDVNKVPLRHKWNEKKSIRLFFVGNISPWHGLDILIIELARLNFTYKGYPVKLDIIGNGVCCPQIKSLVEKYKIERNVIFYGFLNNDRKYKVMSRCDIAVGSLASERRGLRESSNIKLREYCAFGIPFIKSDFDADFDYYDQTKLYVLTVNNYSEINWLRRVLEFAIRVKSDKNISLLMRNHAKMNLDWHVKMRKLIEFLTET